MDLYVKTVVIINLFQYVLLIPNYKLIFSEKKFGGYLDRKKMSLKFESELVTVVWILLNFLLLLEIEKIYTSFMLLLFCYYYFILHRFTSISRGMGAPGYFTFFINKINFLIILVSEYFPNSLNYLVNFISTEIGLIFVVSAVYKIKSGYLTDRGINIGLVNPQWSYFPNFWQKISPFSIKFKILNFLSIYMELLGGIFLCIPKTQVAGFTLITLTFLAVATTVRLGVLCIQIILSVSIVFINTLETKNLTYRHDVLKIILFIIIIAEIISYLVNFMILTKEYNFKFIIRRFVQFMNKYYGISLWRVFTSDITSIYVEVYAKNQFGEYKLLSEWDKWNCFRYRNVGESITITSIFTTLKYFPADSNLFENKLLTHSYSIKHYDFIKYKVYYIDSNIAHSSHEFVLISHFNVNKLNKEISVEAKNNKIDLRNPDKFSAVRKNSGSGNQGF